jgi:phosphinothricin acetyltransferase
MAISIAPMHSEDWPAIDEIDRQGIATANATLETESPGWEKWNAAHHLHSRLVARDREQVLG